VRKNRSSPQKKAPTRRVSDQIQRKREEEIAKFFLSHIHESRRTAAMLQVLTERVKSQKIATFDYTDDYTREWYKSIFHLNKSLKLNKLNVSSENISTFLRKVSEFLKTMFF